MARSWKSGGTDRLAWYMQALMSRARLRHNPPPVFVRSLGCPLSIHLATLHRPPELDHGRRDGNEETRVSLGYFLAAVNFFSITAMNCKRRSSNQPAAQRFG